MPFLILKYKCSNSTIELEAEADMLAQCANLFKFQDDSFVFDLSKQSIQSHKRGKLTGKLIIENSQTLLIYPLCRILNEIEKLHFNLKNAYYNTMNRFETYIFNSPYKSNPILQNPSIQTVGC